MKYPVVVEPSATGFAASPVQFAGFAAAETREEVIRLAAEQVALGLLEDASPPADASEVDLSEYEAGSEIVFVEPAALNPVSLALDAALKQKGITRSELARRMGIPRSSVTRLTDPLYWGHSVRSLTAAAQALDTRLEVGFKPVHQPLSPAL